MTVLLFFLPLTTVLVMGSELFMCQKVRMYTIIVVGYCVVGVLFSKAV